MLDRRHRLTTSAGFTAATRRGRRASSRTLVLHLAVPPDSDRHTDEDPAVPLVGFVVSRSVGNAVVRNQVRRRLRHLVRQRLPALPDAATLVVRALPGAARAPYAVLERDLDTALHRLDGAVRTEGER